jgi:hypothetical protein
VARVTLALFTAAVSTTAPSLAGGDRHPTDDRVPIDGISLWSHNLAVQRLQTIRGTAILRTRTTSGESTRLDVRFMAKLAGDGWGRLLIDRVESAGPLYGSSFLTVERRGQPPSLWVYLPGLGTPRRVTGSSLGDTYLGTEFAYAEFLQPRVEDFDVRLLGEETIGDTSCWKLEAVPKGGREQGTGYGKRELWIRQDNAVERRVLYYDPAGRPLKVLDVYNVVAAGGDSKWIALKRRMRNLRTGQMSVASFRAIQTDVEVDGVAFSPQHLSDRLW